MTKTKTFALLLVLAATLVALPAQGHDPGDEVGKLQREVRSLKTQLDQALQTSQRNANLFQQKSKEFSGLQQNFNRLSNRLDQSLQGNENLQTRRLQLQKRSDAALAVLVDVLDHPKAKVRARAATTLGTWGREGKKAITPLGGLLEDEDQSVRDAAIGALAKIKGK